MRDKTPKLAMLMKRLLEAIKGIKTALQENTEAVHAAQEREGDKNPSGQTERRIISFDDKTACDTKKESNRQYRTQNSIKNATRWAVVAACIYAAIAGVQTYDLWSSSRTDERAWLGVQGVSGIPNTPEVGKPFDVHVAFTNSGKTPAKNVVMWNTSAPSSDLPNVNASCGEASRRQAARFLIAPNAILTQILPVSSGVPLIQGWDTDLAQRGKLYAYGCAVYDDIFDKPHWLTYCAVLDLASKTFDTCQKYNDTGDGKSPEQPN